MVARGAGASGPGGRHGVNGLRTPDWPGGCIPTSGVVSRAPEPRPVTTVCVYVCTSLCIKSFGHVHMYVCLTERCTNTHTHAIEKGLNTTRKRTPSEFATLGPMLVEIAQTRAKKTAQSLSCVIVIIYLYVGGAGPAHVPVRGLGHGCPAAAHWLALLMPCWLDPVQQLAPQVVARD